MNRTNTLARASEFLRGHARPLEMRIFERLFEGGAAVAVADALREFRNTDGGFGHGLEPDVLAPTSQPVAVEFGVRALIEADAVERSLLQDACRFIAGVADPDGGVATLVPSAFEYPRAVHWNGDWAVTPRLNPTASLAALFRSQGIEHPWIERATAWSLERLRTQPVITSGHTLHCALTFLPTTNEPDTAELIERCIAQLAGAEHFALHVPFNSYGLTPLDIAPTADHPLRPYFPRRCIDAHLNHLASQQRPDGGWPIAWTPPNEAAERAWRARWTLSAVRVLRDNDRLT
jgi:hypothetical protein